MKFLFSPKIVALIVLLVAGVIVGACSENPDRVVTENALAKPFDLNQINADNLEATQLVERVVLIEGYIEDINYLNGRTTIILKGKNATSKSVICDMQKNQDKQIKMLKRGDNIQIKGILKGILKDIIVLNCIIFQPQSHE